jgi:hypothetical protein
MGPGQSAYVDDAEKMDEEDNHSTPTFLDILLQGDGRNMGSSTSTFQMAFAILN